MSKVHLHPELYSVQTLPRLCGDYLLESTQTGIGSPRGSILYDPLWDQVCSIASVINRGVSCSLFMDNCAICYITNVIKRQLKLCIDGIHSWSVLNGFNSPRKDTICMHRMHVDPDLILIGVPIKDVKETRFLGITLDDKLSFITHTRHLKTR